MSAAPFSNKVALVTGAASGIGEATVRRLARDGISGLVLIDRDAAGLERLAAGLPAVEALLLAQDVADPAAWDEAEAQARARFGRVDVVVANAGVADGSPLAETSFEAWRRLLSVNLDGAFLTLRAGMRLIGPDGGAMVAVASASAVKAEPGTGAYAASKAGVVQLVKVAAREGAARNIRVNAISPGGVKTPIWRAVPFFKDMAEQAGGEDAAFDQMAKMATPLGRYAEAEEVAGLIAFLLSDAAATMTGANLVCDGGYSA
jgi:NAD(P)-dependent dehydrogenase (short-subunit alcohol dehydrogenase family)